MFNNYPLKYSKYLNVGKSNIHKNGVFTNIKIPKDTLITFYPFDGLEYLITGEFIGIRKFGYGLLLNNNFMIYGNPKNQNKCTLGHLLNDGVYYKNISKTEYNNSNNYNCVFNCLYDIPCVFSSRIINKGEELTVKYGFEYW